MFQTFQIFNELRKWSNTKKSQKRTWICIYNQCRVYYWDDHFCHNFHASKYNMSQAPNDLHSSESVLFDRLYSTMCYFSIPQNVRHRNICTRKAENCYWYMNVSYWISKEICFWKKKQIFYGQTMDCMKRLKTKEKP